jgi:probable rRNA maturation factor
MNRRAGAALKIDVLVDSDYWKDADAAKLVVRRAVMHAAAALSTRAAELAIVLTDDAKMRALNRNWRGIDAATNVLSFPTKNARRRHIGDIVLAHETVMREARREHKPFADHLAHLAVHGFLHLLGYDHEDDDKARDMEETERAILRRMAIPDPYGWRVHFVPRHAKRSVRRRGKTRARAVGKQ